MRRIITTLFFLAVFTVTCIAQYSFFEDCGDLKSKTTRSEWKAYDTVGVYNESLQYEDWIVSAWYQKSSSSIVYAVYCHCCGSNDQEWRFRVNSQGVRQKQTETYQTWYERTPLTDYEKRIRFLEGKYDDSDSFKIDGIKRGWFPKNQHWFISSPADTLSK